MLLAPTIFIKYVYLFGVLPNKLSAFLNSMFKYQKKKNNHCNYPFIYRSSISCNLITTQRTVSNVRFRQTSLRNFYDLANNFYENKKKRTHAAVATDEVGPSVTCIKSKRSTCLLLLLHLVLLYVRRGKEVIVVGAIVLQKKRKKMQKKKSKFF